MTDDEKAARARLGSWLSAEPGRTWDRSTLAGSHIVWLFEKVRNDPNWQVEHEGEGPTLAAAILAALGKVSE